MSELQFYHNPKSRAQIVHWMLEELGEPYQLIAMNYGDALHTPEFLAINPMAKLPAIVHNGHVVTETAAICLYLADAFPEAGLAPPADQRHAYYRWILFAAGPIEQAMMDRHRQLAPDAKEQTMIGYGTWERAISVMASAVPATGYLTGPQFSAADVYFGSQLHWLVQFGMLEDRPAFHGYLQRLRCRPAFQRAMG